MKLSQDRITLLLTELSGWQLDGEQIKKSFQFRDFQHAFAFMTAAALHAERHDHHPDWSNCYNRVEVSLSTHDAGGITEKDFALARCMEEVANCFAKCVS